MINTRSRAETPARFNGSAFVYLLIVFFSIAGKPVQAQSREMINTHSFATGISYGSLRDGYLPHSPGSLKLFSMGYGFSSANAWRKKSLLTVWNRDQQGLFRQDEISIEYRDAFSLAGTKKGKFNMYLGYALSANPRYSQGAENYSWATTNDLAVYGNAVYKWNKNGLSLDLTLPLLGFASRPKTGSQDKEDINGIMYTSYSNIFLTSFHNQQAINLSCQYSRALDKRFGLQLGYKYGLRQLTEGAKYRQENHTIYTGLSWQLR